MEERKFIRSIREMDPILTSQGSTGSGKLGDRLRDSTRKQKQIK